MVEIGPVATDVNRARLHAQAAARGGADCMTQTTVARLLGKVFLAGGFFLGIFGATEGQGVYLRSGLGLLVAGILAMGYALYRTVTHESQDQEKR